MGLFQGKQKSKKNSPPDEVAEAVHEIFDETYREELRRSGQEYFQKIIAESATVLTKELDVTMTQLGAELKEHMTTRLDDTIARLNADIIKQLDGRLAEYDKVAKDAQDQAVQSLNRNAHALHDKYQQLAVTLQQTVSSQEAMMIGVFEENKARMMKTQAGQEMVLQTLQTGVQASQEQAKQLSAVLQKSVTNQEAMMGAILEQSKTQIAAMQSAQSTAVRSLNDSAIALQSQHEQLSAMLQKTISDQQAMMVDTFQDNMARVIEHYLLGAMGDQYDLKAQLPSIIKQMEANKQAMMDDMKL
jgi:hypothetical protein